MGALSTYAANALQNLTLRGDAFSSPASVFLGWFVSPPSADATATEVTGGGYVRKAITFDPASGGTIVSDAAVNWSAFHAGADQMLVGWGIWDAVSAGNLLAIGRTPALVIPMNGPLNVPAAGISVTHNAAHMTHTLADAWLNHLLNATTYSNPATVWLAHYTTTPTATDPGVEVTGGGYVRLPSDWDAAVAGTSALTNTVTWTPLHTDDPQTLSGIALLDDETTGDVLWFADWPDLIDVPAGDTLNLDPAAIAWQAV